VTVGRIAVNNFERGFVGYLADPTIFSKDTDPIYTSNRVM
jgi:hypothetical protein